MNIKFNVMATGLAGGITAAVFNLVVGLLALWWGIGGELSRSTLNTISGNLEWTNVLSAVLWGFIGFFILGALFASLYNTFSQKVPETRHA